MSGLPHGCCRLRTVELPAHVGETVTIAGWLHNRRRLGGVNFALIRDGWGICQVVAAGDEALPEVELESVVAVTGTVVAAAQAPGGAELHDASWTVVSPAAQPPLSLGKRELKATPATLLALAPVALRHPVRRLVFRVAAAAMEAFRSALRAKHFTEIATPKLVGGATESGASVFSVDYFGRQAYLAQSPQFYKQMLVGVFERVFEVGPVFRAEPHDTARHLNQYTSLDAEMGFIGDHTDVMRLVEDVVLAMVEAAGAVAMSAGADRAPAGWRPVQVRRPIPALDFCEAQSIIYRETGRDVRGEVDLSPQDERDLGEWALRTYNSDLLFVTGYPLAKRPFYTHPDPNRSGFTNSFDLLFRGLELVTGGQRLHLYDDYLAALKQRGMSAEPLAGYLQAFRHGMPPHGGFGLGLERFVAQLLGLTNVREAALFPRDMTRLEP